MLQITLYRAERFLTGIWTKMLTLAKYKEEMKDKKNILRKAIHPVLSKKPIGNKITK